MLTPDVLPPPDFSAWTSSLGAARTQMTAKVSIVSTARGPNHLQEQCQGGSLTGKVLCSLIPAPSF